MPENQDRNHKLYHNGFRAGEKHSQPSPKTLEFFKTISGKSHGFSRVDESV